MQLIKSNPYRTVGLLVGATAREQGRQINKLKKLLDAEQEPEDDFSFPALGKIIRTVDNVTESASKLNLDSDKMNASLFWFYNGNPITDEPAFDALKEADIDQAINIWSKLTTTAEVTQRNASAHSNLGTLYLSQNTNEDVLEKGIALKLKFLDSDFIKDLKALATDETYKTTKKELQLIFLNQIQSEIEKSGGITSNKFLEILTKQTFSAKEDFLKGFVQRPIEQIEKKIEEAKTKRKENKFKAGEYGEELFQSTKMDLAQIKNILGVENIKSISIADKLADEVLQCCIDYFNHCQENESEANYFDTSFKLAKLTESIAIGNITKDRIADNITTLEKMKEKEISQAIQVLQSIKNSYEENQNKILLMIKQQGISEFSIDWDKVNNSIQDSINWEKVVALIKETIPLRNVEKIKISDTTKVTEYKSLVDFILSKLNYSQKNQLKYLCYWETSSSSASISTPASVRSDFNKNAWWILGLIGFVIGIALGGGTESIFVAIIGAVIGQSLVDVNKQIK